MAKDRDALDVVGLLVGIVSGIFTILMGIVGGIFTGIGDIFNT